MPIKVVIFKPGLDSHYRGALVVSRYLTQRGMEVVYLGNQLADGAVRAAVQEDADVLGISSLSGNHHAIVPAVFEALRAQGAESIPVVLGGIIPDEDRPAMEKAGVRAIFGPGTPLERIAEQVSLVAGRPVG
ncbi:cobalamin B12-binding domain-containing protein [Kitasatospora sp. Ki12]|uniref:cobalamin B12-binding domain-containing protein n=1 Tax=Kitasatospora xanthocidica TaxID=83382 RepID=UPI001677BDEC|nr:cobalamin-dependent protein [Kitasatospora xanthocidica]GHF89628.1 methylmalonyl-CoA mutase [Kitasatospora xanthocidica]